VRKSFCVSSQLVSKYHDSAAAANAVQIFLCVVRLRHVGTDLLISLNAPTQFAAASSTSASAVVDAQANRAVVDGILKSLTVRDWGLFGPPQ